MTVVLTSKRSQRRNRVGLLHSEMRKNTQPSILIVRTDNQREGAKKIAKNLKISEFVSVSVKLLTEDSQKILQIFIRRAFRWHTQRITSKI